MSHIPDGLIHAYLDGALSHLEGADPDAIRAHLESCAPCRGRLEAERALRAEADALLGEAAPRVTVPPSFEELRRRAKETPEPDGMPSQRSDSERRGPSWGWGLAWAATIAVSLGLGWASRGMSERSNLQVAFRADEAAAVESEAPVTLPIQSDAAEPAPTGARSAASISSAASPSRPSDEASLRLAEVGAAGDVPASHRLGATVTVVVPDSIAERELKSRGAEFADAEQRLTRMRSEQAPAAQPLEQARRRVQDDDATPPPEPAAEEVGESDAVMSAESTGYEPLAVPDLEILSIQPDAGVPGQPGLRILQRLHQGDTLELRYFGLLGGSEARLDASESRGISMKDLPNPPLESGWNQVILERGSGWLVARAPMSRESLEFLLRLLN